MLFLSFMLLSLILYYLIVRWPWVTWKAPPNEMYYYYIISYRKSGVWWLRFCWGPQVFHSLSWQTILVLGESFLITFSCFKPWRGCRLDLFIISRDQHIGRYDTHYITWHRKYPDTIQYNPVPTTCFKGGIEPTGSVVENNGKGLVSLRYVVIFHSHRDVLHPFTHVIHQQHVLARHGEVTRRCLSVVHAVHHRGNKVRQPFPQNREVGLASFLKPHDHRFWGEAVVWGGETGRWRGVDDWGFNLYFINWNSILTGKVNGVIVLIYL